MPAGCSPVRQVSANVHLLFFFVPSACFPAEGLLNFLGISGECASFLGCELWFFEDGGGIGKVDQRKFFATYRLQALVGHGRSKRENLVCRLLLEKKKKNRNMRKGAKRSRRSKDACRVQYEVMRMCSC